MRLKLSQIAQEMLYLWYHEGLDAFEKSLPSGAYFDELAELLRELALEHVEECDPQTVSEPPEDMALLLGRTRGFRDEVVAKASSRPRPFARARLVPPRGGGSARG